MKKYFTLSLFVLLAVAAQCQTYVSGFINANTTWTVANSPYIVNGNALLSTGYTLTIDPGVVVKFDTNRTLQIDGELIAIGTAANRITFTSLQPSPHAGDWGKIHFSDTCVDAVFDTLGNYLSGCIMKYCDVLYGGSLGYGEVHIVNSSPYFNNCRIKLSSSSGIYLAGNSYLLESSVVSDCSMYGLNFDSYSCMQIKSDTIQNNSQGGIHFNQCACQCRTIVNNCYFSNNSQSGAISVQAGIHNVTISENYFFNNSGNNASNFAGGLSLNQVFNDSINCNHFINNQNGVITAGVNQYLSSGVIMDNVFLNNTNSGAPSILNISCGFFNDDSVYFSNNILQGNSSSGYSICEFGVYLNNSNMRLQIDHNDFNDNISNNVIRFDAPIINNSPNFLFMKYNNFSDASSTYEIYNNIAYGSSNIYADSNYWGSTITQHIDSVIYDYFDYGNLSVVYYQPILNNAVEVDTSCSLGFPAIITQLKDVDVSSTPFPNPFSTYTEITVGKELNDASLLLYNVFGQKVREMDAINGKNISISRDGLPSGIYIYEIIEKEQRIGNGKLVVE